MRTITKGIFSGFIAVFAIIDVWAASVAKIGETPYATLAEAFNAAKAMTGSVTVEIYEKVTLDGPLSGNFSSISFVGKDTDAEIYLDIQGAIYASDKTVSFADISLSKSQGGYVADAGFRNLAFGIFAAKEVNYVNCKFINGAYASSGKAKFTNCTFYPSHDRYGLWVYGDVECVVDGCTFDATRGIKLYAEGLFKTNILTVKNTDFSVINGKPAIVLCCAESVTLEGNTYSSTGVFELDLDGVPNGTTVTSDVPPTCINDNGACGVLVDGKIYTTVAQAAEVSTSASTITLLHDSAETVELPEGVTLDKNGFTADGVTVKQPAKNIEVTDANGNVTYYAGFTGFSDLDLANCTIKLLNNVSDANLILNKGSSSKIVDTNVTLDLNGYTFSRTGSSSGAISLTQGSGLTIRDSSDAKTGKILVDTYAIWMMNGDFVLESGTIETTSTKNAAIYANTADVAINDGKIISAGNAITVGENFMESRGTSAIAISGGEIIAAGVGIKNGSYAQDSTAVTVTGGTIDSEGDSINMEQGSAQVSGGTFSSDVSDYCVDGYESKKNADGTYGVVVATPAVAKIGETPYATLAEALAAAQAGDTVELLSNVIVGGYETNKFENINLTAINGAELTVEENGEVHFIGANLTNVKITGAGTTRFYNTINFYGANNILSAINGTPFDLIVNKQSTLFITRFVLGYNRNITVFGDIEDASVLTGSDIAGMTPSLKFNSSSGVSVGGTDVGNLTVKDAYIELGNSSWKNAYGTYDWNFTNSYVSAMSLFNATAGSSSTAKWNVTFDDCVLSAKNYIKNGVGVTINFYNGSVATTGSMRIDGELNIDKTSSVSVTLQQNNVVGKPDEHGGINGTVNIAGTLTVASNAKTQLEVLGGKINIKGGTLNLGNNTLTLDSASEMTSSGDVTGAIVVADGASVSLTGGTYMQDVAAWCAEGYSSVKQPGENLWQVGKLPNAEVVNMGPTEISDYKVWNGSLTEGTKPINLQVALEFIAKDTPEQAGANAYGDYTTDFYITIDGANDGSFVADGCYLAGNYGTFGWIVIPLDGMAITNGVVHPVITSAFAGSFDFSYQDICTSVKDFKCGIYFSPEVLDANPNLSVSLNLGLSETIEKAQKAEFTPAIEKPFVYDTEDMTQAVAISGPYYYTKVSDAVADALETDDSVKLVLNAEFDEDLAIASDLVFNLGGNTLEANDKALSIADSVVTITNGTLSGFTAENVTLTGNAILTVTDKNVADSFRADESYYVSANDNGTYSIMLKSAFRLFIAVVGNEARLGFFKDGDKNYVLKGATNLENPEWTSVEYSQVTDVTGDSKLPLYWVKPKSSAENGHCFFKLTVE